MLGQQTPEHCPGKTTSTDEQTSFTWKIHTNVLSNKSHFRSIAPKMAPAVITQQMLNSHHSSLPDVQNNSISLMSPKPVVMAAQNYALMQVAGQEGTFSLVALPQVPPQGSGQQQRITVPDNLKLPIPRYQSARKRIFENNSARHSIPGSSCKTFKTKVHPEAQLMTVAPVGSSEPLSTEITSENVVYIDSTSTEVVDTSQIERDTVISVPGTESATTTTQTFAELERVSPEPVIVKHNSLSVSTDSEDVKDLVVVCPKTDVNMDSTSAVNVSSAIIGNTVQVIQFPQVGKLPVLPYSKIENTIYSHSEESSEMDGNITLLTSAANNLPALVENSIISVAESGDTQSTSFSDICKSINCERICPPAKCHMENSKQPKVWTGKRRGRKRKVPDGTLTLQTKRKSYNYNKGGDNKDKVKVVSQEAKQKNTEVSKRYRSIMPKVVFLVQALPSERAFSYRQTDDLSSESGIVCKGIPSASKPWHKCHICNRTFQLKHHLEDHMNTHMNRRPYSCRLCRKSYVHSGSLNTHMKLHHSESRLKKLIPCEFCSKVFGHVRVYFGHLKEVHKVIIGTEVTTAQEVGETVKKSELMVAKVDEKDASLEGETTSSIEDDFLQNQGGEDEVKLQMKCGRCHLSTLTFSEMKFHLLYDHGEEIDGQPKEGVLQTTDGGQEELLKHAALHWKQWNERRSLVKCDHCEELCSGPKLKKHMSLFHPDLVTTPVESKAILLGNNEPVQELQEVDTALQNQNPKLYCDSGLNCVLCKQMFARKEDLFSHWQNQHSCEEPSVLWTIFSSYFEQK
ncbi:zinc finger protein 438 [Lissotriton helveticus]